MAEDDTLTSRTPDDLRLVVLSDIHFASDAEKAKGDSTDSEIPNPVARWLAKLFHHVVWQRDLFGHNHWLDKFLEVEADPDCVIALGDYSVGTSAVGVSDDASFASASECLGRLRQRYGGRLRAVFGDHELGKASLFGGPGGPRLASWRRACHDLDLRPFWQMDWGVYRFVAVVSTLVALPLYLLEIPPNEQAEWQQLREQHLAAVRGAFESLAPRQRIILLCHDPTALAFLWREPAIHDWANRIDLTLIGHLHTQLVWWKCRCLAGMPRIDWMGSGVRRVSAALNDARVWRHFKVRLCPSLAGIQLWRNSGYWEIRLQREGARSPRFFWRALRHRW